MLDAMMSGFGWGVMLGVMVMLAAGATVTLSPALLAGVGGSFWQGVKRVTS